SSELIFKSVTESKSLILLGGGERWACTRDRALRTGKITGTYEVGDPHLLRDDLAEAAVDESSKESDMA
ncbi:hypothetical protein Tco_0616954, partial [Tanacetum coccineum]